MCRIKRPAGRAPAARPSERAPANGDRKFTPGWSPSPASLRTAAAKRLGKYHYCVSGHSEVEALQLRRPEFIELFCGVPRLLGLPIRG